MKKHQCEKCGKQLTCSRCTGSRGGSKTGPTKSRPSDKMRQAALIGWHNRRTKARSEQAENDADETRGM